MPQYKIAGLSQMRGLVIGHALRTGKYHLHICHHTEPQPEHAGLLVSISVQGNRLGKSSPCHCPHI